MSFFFLKECFWVAGSLDSWISFLWGFGNPIQLLMVWKCTHDCSQFILLDRNLGNLLRNVSLACFSYDENPVLPINSHIYVKVETNFFSFEKERRKNWRSLKLRCFLYIISAYDFASKSAILDRAFVAKETTLRVNLPSWTLHLWQKRQHQFIKQIEIVCFLLFRRPVTCLRQRLTEVLFPAIEILIFSYSYREYSDSFDIML